MGAAPNHCLCLVKGLPRVGNLPKFLRDPLGNAESLTLHSKVLRQRSCFDTVTLLGPDAKQFVLHDREANPINRGGWACWIGAVFPGAIMAMDDPPSTSTTAASCQQPSSAWRWRATSKT